MVSEEVPEMVPLANRDSTLLPPDPIPRPTRTYQKVLVVDTGYIGDLIMLEMAGVGNVSREIHFCGLTPLLYMSTANFIPYRGLRTILDLRRERFDLSIHTNTSFKINLILFLSGIKERLGYDYKGRGFLNTIRVPIKTRTHRSKYRVDEIKHLLREGLNAIRD